MTEKQRVVIVNRKAGTARKLGRARLLEALQVVNRPIQLLWLHPSEISSSIQKLIDDSADEIVVGGGDGTINQAVQYLAGTKIVLFPLPLGTMNPFFKDLQLPSNFDEFLPLMNNKASRLVDVGCVNNQYFLNNVSLGMYPLVVRYRSIVRFSQLFPKIMATIYALLKVLLRHQSRRSFTWRTNKGDDIQSPMFLIANNSYEFDMSSFVHRKQLDDGSLMIIAPVDVKLFTLLEAILYAWTDRIEHAQCLDVRKITEIVINTNADYTHGVIDGELTKLRTPITLCTKRAALYVIDSSTSTAS